MFPKKGPVKALSQMADGSGTVPFLPDSSSAASVAPVISGKASVSARAVQQVRHGEQGLAPGLPLLKKPKRPTASTDACLSSVDAPSSTRHGANVSADLSATDMLENAYSSASVSTSHAPDNAALASLSVAVIADELQKFLASVCASGTAVLVQLEDAERVRALLLNDEDLGFALAHLQGASVHSLEHSAESRARLVDRFRGFLWLRLAAVQGPQRLGGN